MSIVVQFGLPPANISDAPIAPCLVETEGTLEMGPGLDHDPDMPVMSEDDNSMIDLSTSNIRRNSVKENRTSVAHYGLGSCFGLPYQDHNYGAPPPPTPPSFSPPHQSPVRINNIVDEDTNFSVISTSTVNEETHEGSITRCICDYDHDDEYMICCDKCLVWQHVDCMGLDRTNMPETYMCEKCEPRKVDKQKAKILQARKRVALTADTSDESEEDCTNPTGDHMCKSKNKHMKKEKRKEEEKGDRKSEQVIYKKNKATIKHHKERLELKRAKLRRRTKSKSDGTSTADEEAQDAWESSLEWYEKYDQAESNQYTPAVQQLASTLMNHEDEQKIFEQLQLQFCRVCELGACQKRLVSVCDLSRDQIIMEYRGRFLTASQFHSQHLVFSKRLFPFVLFYKLDFDEDLCVDATEYGNDARFVRRSCKPNSEVQHVVLNGSIHLYISSTKEISKDEEITIPFDFSSKECIKEVDCACEDENCLFSCKKNGIVDSGSEKKRKSKRSSFTEDDSSQSLPGVMSSPTKSHKNSPVKPSNYDVQQVTVSVSSSTAESSESKMPSDEQENDELLTKNRRKMTREERKIDAIMRAFDQMEKAAKRRKQALDRLAQQKSQHPKVDEQSEKVEVVSSVAKEEEKQNTLPNTEVVCIDDDKSTVTSIVNPTIKHKKGKRRRGSGTPSRRRMRTNSGGSDILSPDEMLTSVNVLQCPTTPLSLPSDVSLAVITSPSSSSATTHNSAPSPGLPLTPVIPKTKRFLMHGWLQEKAESSVPISCPLSIHTEVSWNVNTAVPTCYVRCTKDSPSAGGISAAHLRRSSTSSQNKQSSGQGSAKKRWLKQAMYECGSCDVLSDGRNDDHIHSPLHNGCLSPGLHIEINNTCISPHEDVVTTPLKKRRLMRESIESLSSPKSPSTPLTASDWLATSSESPENSCSGPSVEETFPPVVLSAAHQPSCEGVCHPAQNKVIKESSAETYDETKLGPHLNTPKTSKNKCVKADKKMEMEDIVSLSCLKCDDVTEHSQDTGSADRSSHSISVPSEKLQCSEQQDSSNVVCLDLSHKVGSSGEFVINRTKSEVVSFNVSSGSSSSPGPSEETSSTFCDKTDLTQNDAQAAGVIVMDSTGADLRKLSFSDKDDGSQEPSSTTVDCVSSTSCSSVNNDCGPNPVTSSELPLVHSHVSSSCPADESMLSDTFSSRSLNNGQVSSSTVLCDLPCRSVEPDINHVDTKTVVTSSVASSASLHAPTASLTSPVVSSTAVKCAESTTSVSEAVSNLNCGTGVSSSGMLLMSSCEESTSSTTSTSGVSSSAVPCDSLKLQGSEKRQYCTGGTRKLLNRHSPVQGVSSTSMANCGMLMGQSSSQKRKVSLSEYRKRMRDHVGEPSTSKVKGSSSVGALPLKPEVLPDHPVDLPELPLFEGGSFPYGAEHQQNKQVDSQASKRQDVDTTAEDQVSSRFVDNSRPREELSQRLKREFGLDDNSDSEERNDSFQKNHKASLSSTTLLPGTPSMVPILSCPQPPPPPPSSSRPTTSQQFSHPVNQSYSPQSCVVAQVSASPFATTQPSGAPTGVLPVLCHINTSSVTARPLIQSSPSYSAVTHASVPRPSQTAYPSATCHSYSATLVQQPPPPPPPPPHQGYRRIFKPALFK